MAATRPGIVEQIRRFSGHPNFPADQRELAKALEDVAIDDEHLKQVCDQLMRTARFCPVPGDVYAAVEIVAEQRRYGEAPSPYDQPGSFGPITQGMTAADAAKWEHLAEHGKNEYSRSVAREILASYRAQNPHLKTRRKHAAGGRP